MIQENLKRLITDELIAHRVVTNRLNYIVNEFKGFIYDESGNFSKLKNGEEVYDFIKQQDSRLSEIDNRPRDYSELYRKIGLHLDDTIS